MRADGVAFNLKAYESQAKFSVVIGVLAAGALFATTFLILQRFDFESFTIPMRRTRFFVILGGIAVALALAFTGFMVGFNSAGQKRNKQSRLSWMGFFLNAAAMALALSAFVFFWMTKYLSR